MSKFDALVAELEDLQKGFPDMKKEDDKKKPGEAEADATVATDDDDEEENGDQAVDAPMKKALTVTDESGGKHVAVDGTELLKAITDRMEESDAGIAKVLGPLVGLVKNQGALIKSLTDKLDAIGGQGKGRKAVVTIADKQPTLVKSGDAPTMSPDEFMAKAMDAFNAGKITGSDIATAEAEINSGRAVSPAIVARVLRA